MIYKRTMTTATLFGVAGVPKSLGETRDYDKIFGQLKASGMSVFFGTFQFQEVPTGLSLGFEGDFLPPCQATDKPFVALKAHGIKLLVPGNLIYPPDQEELPPLDSDPLRQLLACTGTDGIYGVSNYDEPSHTNITDSQLKRLFDRVKLVEPTLRVLMVHAPLFTDQAAETYKPYLDVVVRQSAFADVVGFDVYAVPPAIVKIANPDGSASDDPADAIGAYMSWIRQKAPTKSFLMVLQGHSIADVFAAAERDKFPPEILNVVRPPNLKETRDMARRAVDGNASIVIWWGPSFVKSDATPPWASIRSTVAELTNASISMSMSVGGGGGGSSTTASVGTASIANTAAVNASAWFVQLLLLAWLVMNVFRRTSN
jgi:hypothetical protein